MEAKLCPDGSYVGRIGPDCHFAACPGATSIAATSAGQLPAVSPSHPVVPPASSVRIYSITPQAGPVGTEVTIEGFGFADDNTVHFGSGVVLHAAASSGGPAIMCAKDAADCHAGIHQSLTFAVPETIAPACAYAQPIRCMIAVRETQPGTYAISVSNANGTSNEASFTVTSEQRGNGAPVIVSMTPGSGSVGTEVTIGGDNLDGARVRFGAGVITGAAVKPAVFPCPMMLPEHAGGCGDFSETLSFAVPASVGAYCKAGEMCPMFRQAITRGSYRVSVETDTGVSAPETFTVTGE